MYCKRVLAGIALWMLSLEAAVALDLTGKWSPRVWTVQPALFQSGDHVWGYGGAKDVWFRGNWSDGTLVLVATQLDVVHKKCVPRGAWVVTGISPNPGEKVDYPYAQELNLCGSLRTYELSFARGSDQLQGADWPILAATAALLKQDSRRIEIAGHTDSTGDAQNNQDLSERRASTVKKVLVDRYGADANRITTKGLGQSQPLQEDSTAEGRALNRRVEIVRAQ
jgi:outer membrane protein OmpA-like peptidoglycan-associated protein